MTAVEVDSLSYSSQRGFQMDFSSDFRELGRQCKGGEHEDEHGLILQEFKLPPLGRVFSILLSAKPQDLQIPPSANGAAHRKGVINRALAALLQHANVEVEKGSDLNNLLLPLLDHVVSSRDRSSRKEVISIIVWLVQDALIGGYVLERFVDVIESRHIDNRAKLGWCVVARDLLQQRVEACKSSSGLRDTALIPFGRCIPKLFDIILKSSSKDMPTRLSVLAADCIIFVSKFMGDESILSPENEVKSSAPCPGIELINTSVSDSSSIPQVLGPSERNSGDMSTSGWTELVAKKELLWDQLDTLLKFVFKLRKWNAESRPLYAKGLQQITKCLENLVCFRDGLVGQGGGEKDLAVLKAVLSTCWNRYGELLLIDRSTTPTECKVMCQQWLEGLQHSLHVKEIESDDEASSLDIRRVEEMRIFFLTCLTLLLGRVSMPEIEDIIAECRPMFMQALFGMLHSKNGDVVDLAIAILRTLLFQTELANGGTLKIDTVAPLLMDLLDEQDSASMAVVALIADYFAMNPRAPEMERLFRILGSGNSAQRQNALGVLSELLGILSSSNHDMANALRQSVAVHLLKCLGDAELANRIEVSRLFSQLDPEFVLPALVQHLYSRNEKVRSAASSSILSVLKAQNHQTCAALCVLLDCARNMSQKVQRPLHPGDIGVSSEEISLSDVDRIMRLIPSWADEVQGWENIINVVLSKMFSDPSNPVMPRFLSQISSQLLQNIDLVFKRVFAFMAEQTPLSEGCIQTLSKGNGQFQEGLNCLIFERLSPLLVLKVLPLAAFDGSCEELYGSNPGGEKNAACEELCITNFLMDRACGKLEAYEVRKLAAELLGRCSPKIILVRLKEKLEHALESKSIVEIKSCLFSLCNIVLLRGKDAIDSPWMPCFQTMVMQILLWPCSPADTDTSNVQHGAIDFLALIIIAELEISTPTTGFIRDQQEYMQRQCHPKIIEEVQADTCGMDTECQQNRTKSKDPETIMQESVLSWVISCVVGYHEVLCFLGNDGQLGSQITEPTMSPSWFMPQKDSVDQTAFRLCMTNVLIRVTQKLAPKRRHHFLQCILAPVMDFIQAGRGSHIKAACLQLLFSIVHNFKEQILDHAADLFTLSVGIMRSKAPSKERLAATRLLASLLTSADVVMNELAPYLSEALVTLESISRMDSSPELRGFCEKLLDCMTPSESSFKPL